MTNSRRSAGSGLLFDLFEAEDAARVREEGFPIALATGTLALVTLTVLPFVFGAAFVFRGLIRKTSWDIRIRLARINAYLQERVSGIRVGALVQHPASCSIVAISDGG